MYSNKYSKSNEFFMIWKMLSIDFKTKKLREGLFFFYVITAQCILEWRKKINESSPQGRHGGVFLSVEWRCVWTDVYSLRKQNALKCFLVLFVAFFVSFARLSSWFKQLISIDFALIQFLEFIVRLWVTFIFFSKRWLVFPCLYYNYINVPYNSTCIYIYEHIKKS